MGLKCMRENNVLRPNDVGVKFYQIIQLTIVLLLFSCHTSSNKNEDIRLNPVADKEYHFTVEMSEHNSHHQKTNVSRSDFKLTFIPVSDSLYDFAFQFISVDTSILRYLDEQDSLRRRNSADRKKGHRKKYSQAFEEAKNAVFSGRIHANGVILSIKGFDEMRRRIGTLFNMDSRDVHSMLRGASGDELVEQLLNMILLVIPGKKVKPKDTWVKNETINTRAPVKNSHLITYRSLTADTAVLDVETIVSAKTGDEGSVYKLGKGTGVWKVDLHSGLPYEWNSNQLTDYRTNYDTISFSLTIKGWAIQ